MSINRQIAEFVSEQLGWTKLKWGVLHILYGISPTGDRNSARIDGKYSRPDWLVSRDAAQDVVETLKPSEHLDWLWALEKIVTNHGDVDEWKTVNATARQRIEAFVKVIKKEGKG